MKFHNRIRKIVIFSIFLIFSSFLFAANKKVKVGFITDMPYLMQQNPYSGFMEGYGYEYLQMISNFTGWEYEYVYGRWYDLWHKLLAGEIDMMEDISFSKERTSKLLYPAYAMGKETYRLYVNDKTSEINIENVNETLKGKKIGITADSYQLYLFKKWLKEHRIECNIIEFISDAERNAELAAGNLDAAVEVESSSLPNWEPIIEIGSSDFYLGISNTRPDLLTELNKTLTYLDTIVPDFISGLFYKYYAHTVVPSRLSAPELAWIKEHEVLHCGYIADPYEIDRDIGGICQTIINQMIKALDINNLAIEFHEFTNFDALGEALASGVIDVAYPVYGNPNAAEKENYSILTDVSSFTVSVVTKKDFDYTKSRKIGVLNNKSSFYFGKKCFPEADFIKHTSFKHLLNEVANGSIDGVIIPDRILTDYFNTKRNYANLQATQLNNVYTSSIGIRKGDSNLFMLLKRGTALLDPQFISTVVSQYSVIKADYSLKTFFYNNIAFCFFAVIFIFAILFFLIVTAFKQTLLKQNYNKEKSLRQALAEALKSTQEHQKREKELLYLSETDKLTGIPNRGAEHKIKSLMEHGQSGMFCLFDVDKFKGINDNYGHIVGDKVLIEIADCMKRVFRDSDIILRLGGDEFAAFTIGITEKTVAEQIIKRFFNEIEKITIPELNGVKIELSLGATFINPEIDKEFEQAYKRADAGCYQSKKNYGNSVTFS